MRSLLLFTFFLPFSHFTLAQRNLTHSIQHSAFTYVYKIDEKERAGLEKTGMKKVNEKYLHDLVDSFLTVADEVPVLRPGHYLLVHARRNQLIYLLHSPRTLDAKIISNDHDLYVTVNSLNGINIEDAIVHIDTKNLRYNKSASAYGPIKLRKAKHVKVEHQKVVYTFPVDVQPIRKTPWLTELTYKFPLKFLFSAARNTRSHGYTRFYRGTTRYERKFRSFMVFNKPLYKPGDTVRMKAFVQSANGKPVNRKLLLRICDNSFTKDTILATIIPYRAGGYEYVFVLSDSLDIDLDDEYLITLEELRSKKFDLEKYEGDLDEDEYAAKRLVLARGKFTHEDYELGSISFKARADKNEHRRGEELSVFLKASDENEMAVMDGRIELIVKTPEYGTRKFNGRKVFLADTLWTHSQPLETIGETRIRIPDSVFPRASFNYAIECRFLNANNELQTETLFGNFIDEIRTISFSLREDSLVIEHRQLGLSRPAMAKLKVFNEKDSIDERWLPLPTVVEINPFATRYEASIDSLIETYTIGQGGSVSCLASRTKDSLFVQLVNPREIPVWYSIFEGSKLVHRGYGAALQYAERIASPGNYFVSLQYIYGNRVNKENFTIPYRDKLLTIKTDQPDFIYPGQQVRIGIQVTDNSGKPVQDADITAYAFTKKFQSSAPEVPYLGKYYPLRKRRPDLRFQTKEELEKASFLNWERWSREMKLDTIEFYKFLHPDGIYLNEEPASEQITQLAPFVVHKGQVLPVHMMYIDEVPVFFSQAQHMRRYSFRVSPGKHSIRLRTRNHSIFLDSFRVREGVKTLMSIDADTSNHKVSIEKMPDTLSSHERDLWSRYMILVQNNFGENFAYIRQGGKVSFLNGNNQARGPLILTGPHAEYPATMVLKNKYSQDFEPEGSWQFIITKGLVKQRQLLNKHLFSSKLPSLSPEYEFEDYVLTEQKIDSLWQAYVDERSSKTELFLNNKLNKNGNGKLQVGLSLKAASSNVFIKNLILFKHDNADFIKIFTGSTRDLGYQKPGMYRLMFLLKKDDYFLIDSIEVKRDGINYYEADLNSEKTADEVSRKIAAIIQSRPISERRNNSEGDLEIISETFNNKFLDPSTFRETVTGVVRDTHGAPVTYATIRVKGTLLGTKSNERGEFFLRTPREGYFVVGAVGFQEQEILIDGNTYHNIVLVFSNYSLSEVVVTGYGTSRKRDVTGSITMISGNTLQGKIAGVMIRGNSSNSPAPLIMLDGLPYPGSLEDLDKSIIAKIEVLKGEDAVAIYGAKAAGGVLIVTTNKNATIGEEGQQIPGNTLRRNFRDDAYWYPKLRTDVNGHASFQAVFPDDITNWKTFLIAIGDHKRSGFLEQSVKSFKAVSANLSMPQFAVEGDSINVIGKTLNYLPGDLQVHRSFSMNDKPVKQDNISLRTSWIDSFTIVAPRQDSLKLKYEIKKEDGYFDGEERSIQVFRPGVLETSGMFVALTKDTSFSIGFPSDTGQIKIHAESSLLDVFYGEAESVREYEYLCNEQLASKLKAMLVQKKIDQHLKRRFSGENNIRDLISRLNKNKAVSGLWGWWNNNPPLPWISLHVTEAMMDAQRLGYPVSINSNAVSDYLVFALESFRGMDRISSLLMLHALGSKADFRRDIDSLEKHGMTNANFYQQLRLVELKQKIGLPVRIDTLIAKQHRTAFGNTYWGEDGYDMFENSIQLTLCMYRILKMHGGYGDLLETTRNYFVEKRKGGKWRNTYESSLILEAILPDLLGAQGDLRPAALKLIGRDTINVVNFPFHTYINKGEFITVSKQGSLPVYLTAYEQHWNTLPEKIEGNFSVSSSFVNGTQTVQALKGGVPVVLKVVVKVKADADYVMIEIPIPAGCSYKDKSQAYLNNEVHREYFRNKVSLFCNSMRKGNYEFTVSLLPRYTGVYTLNPAKAEMMYFPIFNGREGIKKINIGK